ncbi:hypothetical protein RhiirC2_709172 [Rhizophagus irregularis]|uniref:Uncharacterized protein n=1 Tax=Rhizophagus irregularis TaxID=588596 RepID=A0A2N1NJH6_9GLOM|nr:hypothetical protein RhiirC2_709172 [Rhizophagus irregularis]
MTSPERIYRKLGNFASRIESLQHPFKEDQFSIKMGKSKTLNEQEVVDLISKWRLEEKTPQESSNGQLKNKVQSNTLNKDNIAPEEVVDIIKNYQKDEKIIKYNQLKDSATNTNNDLLEKIYEIERIFIDTSNKMEWDHINSTITMDLKKK